MLWRSGLLKPPAMQQDGLLQTDVAVIDGQKQWRVEIWKPCGQIEEVCKEYGTHVVSRQKRSPPETM